MGRYVAKSIPDCQPTYFPQDGHLSTMINHFEEVLTSVIG
jgi:hypothetical protein